MIKIVMAHVRQNMERQNMDRQNVRQNMDRQNMDGQARSVGLTSD